MKKDDSHGEGHRPVEERMSNDFKPTNIGAGPCPVCKRMMIAYNRDTGEARCEGVTVYPVAHPMFSEPDAFSITEPLQTRRVPCPWIGRFENGRLQWNPLEVMHRDSLGTGG